MAQRPGYSPSFKRPAEIMRLRRRRAQSETAGPPGLGTSSPGQSASSTACVRPFSPGPLHLRSPQGRSSSVGGGGVKRRNPFASIENTQSSSPKRRLLIYRDDQGAGSAVLRGTAEGLSTEAEAGGIMSLSDALVEAGVQEKKQTFSKKRLDFSEDDSLFDDEEEEEEEEEKSPLMKSPGSARPASIAPPLCPEYPADWSLKTRVLFTSPLPFSWAEKPRAQEEASGLAQHCRGHHAALPHSIQEPRTCSELRCAFQQSLLYWQHPSLPWLSLFPRINAERSFAGKSVPWAHDPVLQHSLMSEWSASLTSLYSLLKAGLCPYFYLCSYQFTVLFRAAGVGGAGPITALLAPTTRGLRDAMTSEGIEFTLPLVEERRRSREQNSTTKDQSSELRGGGGGPDGGSPEGEGSGPPRGGEGGEDDEGEDEDWGFSWLMEMGVQDKIKKPDSISIQMRGRGGAVAVDRRPDSVVRVAGAHAFTLLNFLLGGRGLVAASGAQAGLPPTLLAPAAFRGAALHALRVRSVNVKAQVRSGFQDVCSLELTGPILPSALHAVTRLLRPAQRGGFSATLYTHAPTAVLNTHAAAAGEPPVGEAGGGEPASPGGLHPASMRQLQLAPTLGRTALRHLHMSNYSYTWMS